MKDYLLRASGSGLRAIAAITTQLTEEARLRHRLLPLATAALGRTMTAGLLLAANIKTEETITIRIQGNGPLGQIVADARSDGKVRGYVDNPDVDLPLVDGKLAVGMAVGQGFIHVTRFTGLKDPFTGSVPLVSGEIASDVTQYLLVSEQTPSSVSLGVLVNPDGSVQAAGGLFIQAMPDVDEGILEKVETNIYSMPPISQLVAEGNSPAQILALAFTGLSYSLLNESPLQFYCACDRERVEKILLSLGKQELEDLASEGKAELTCHFCNEQYQFSAEDLMVLVDQANK